jgi:hypothetical protein
VLSFQHPYLCVRIFHRSSSPFQPVTLFLIAFAIFSPHFQSIT